MDAVRILDSMSYRDDTGHDVNISPHAVPGSRFSHCPPLRPGSSDGLLEIGESDVLCDEDILAHERRDRRAVTRASRSMCTEMSATTWWDYGTGEGDLEQLQFHVLHKKPANEKKPQKGGDRGVGSQMNTDVELESKDSKNSKSGTDIETPLGHGNEGIEIWGYT